MRGRIVILIAMCEVALLGQTPTSPMTTLKAPSDKAVDFKNADLNAVSVELAAKGMITQRVLEGGTYSVNVRHISGAETALVHGKITEVWVVRDGSGTVATGGTLVDPKPGSSAGEFSGSSIIGGVERTISAGDIVFIPPGVPHGMKETKSITYMNIRFETK
jgi:mannose-6-phosphate isomerase-like protein (cupin superfamily)